MYSKDILVTVRNDEELNLKMKEFDRDILPYLQRLSSRWYDGNTQSWVIPYRVLDEVKKKVGADTLDIQDGVMEHMAKAEAGKKEAKRKEGEKEYLACKDYEFKTQPFAHQLDAFEFGLEHKKFLLADQQGLGKTLTSVSIMAARKEAGLVSKCLVICGVNTTKYNWENEIKMHSREDACLIDAGGTPKRVKQIEEWFQGGALFGIINIEGLRKKEIMQAFAKGKIDAIIFDEAHKAKNPKSQQGIALRSLKARYEIALTGTPITNNVLDFWATLDWLDAEDRNYWQFRDAYCELDRWHSVVGYKNLDSLNEHLVGDGIMLRRTKDDVLDLPPKIHKAEYVDLSKAEWSKYADARNDILENLGEILNAANPLTRLLRLRQVTDGLYTDDKDNAKLARVKEIIEDEIVPNGQKAIIYSCWEAVASMYKDALVDYNPAYITGSVDAKKRQEEVDRFQTDPDCRVIIGTIGAMGTGITLNKASTVIFTDKAWTPADNEQAEDRAHRIGTAGTVNVITMVAKNTVDERIEEILTDKQEIFDLVVEGKSSMEKREALMAKILDISEKELKKAKAKAKAAAKAAKKEAEAAAAETKEAAKTEAAPAVA